MSNTINSTVDGIPVSITSANPIALELAEAIFAEPSVAIVTGSETLNNYAVQQGVIESGIANAIGVPQFGYFVTRNAGPITITGGGTPAIQAVNGTLSPVSPTETYAVLTTPGASFVMGSSTIAAIVAGDNTGSSIINNNLSGHLVAYTGAGGNALVGEGLVDAFNTAQGGVDAVLFAAAHEGNQVNNLVSQGQDLVNIDGSAYGGTQTNTIITQGAGSDTVFLTGGASLAFINQSGAGSVIAANAGSLIAVGGTGPTAIVAGGGAETFGFLGAQNAALDVIADFTSKDTIVLTTNLYTAAVQNGSTVITFGSNHQQIVLPGISDSAMVSSRIVAA